MEFIKKEQEKGGAVKITAEKDGVEIGHVNIKIIYNDLHKEPYGLLEDVFVEVEYRSQGIGRDLVRKIIEEAKKRDCYKIIGTSRHSRNAVHEFYKSLGFKNHGLEFRVDFE